MGTLTDRLEVRLPRQTVKLLRQEAQRRRVSVAQLVREAVDLLLQQDREARIQAAEALFRVEAPVADWEEMKAEIDAARRDVGLHREYN